MFPTARSSAPKSASASRGVVDLTGINGYYALLAMQLNVAGHEPPKGAKRLPRLSP